MQIFATYALKSAELKEEEKTEEDPDGECDNGESDEEEIIEDDEAREFDVQNIMQSDDVDDEKAKVSPQPALPLISSESDSDST